jgi:hypothetical protein
MGGSAVVWRGPFSLIRGACGSGGLGAGGDSHQVIALNATLRVREFGTPELPRLWKDLRIFRERFPIYQQGIQKDRVFKTMDDLKNHRKMGKE